MCNSLIYCYFTYFLYFPGKDNPLITRTMLGLAKAYSDNDEGSKSIEIYHQVLNLMERIKGQEDESLVIPLTHLGHTLLEEERAKEAEGVLQRYVEVGFIFVLSA